MNNVIELNKNVTTPKSVCNKLNIHQAKIKHMTAIVTWKDGDINILSSEMSSAECCKHEKILSISNNKLFSVEEE